MASIVINGDTSGSVTLQAPAAAGATVLTLPSTSGTVLTTASGQWITSGSNIYYNTGNVGIGTTAPTTKLNIYDNAAAVNVNVTGDGFDSRFTAARYSTDGNAPFFITQKYRGTLASPTAVISGDGAGTFAFQAYGGTNLRTIANIVGAVETYTSDTNISGNIRFSTNIGGTGVTEQMRITAAGNVGIGTSIPNTFPGKLAVIGDGIVTDYDMISRVSSVLSNADRGFKQITDGSGEFSIYSPNGGGCVFGIGSSYTERMRIDSSGNVGIGTASPYSGLNIKKDWASGKGTITSQPTTSFASGGITGIGFLDSDGTRKGYLLSSSTGIELNTDGFAVPIILKTNDTERMRIDSSGNVLVGTTSTSNSVVGLRFNNSVSSGFMQILSTKSISGELNFLMNYHNGTYVGGINYTNTATSFPTSSDIRLKKDIVDAPSATQKIDNIRIVSHGWKHDDEVVDFGIIAQDLYNVAPRAVTKGDDGEEIEKTWSVDYSKLVPMLIKAHQEQQTIINDLKARIETLENK